MVSKPGNGNSNNNGPGATDREVEEKSRVFFSTKQKEIINHITKLFNKLSVRIDKSSSQSTVEATAKSVQPSQVDGEQIGGGTLLYRTTHNIQKLQLLDVKIVLKMSSMGDTPKTSTKILFCKRQNKMVQKTCSWT